METVRERPKRELHKAICSECGCECEVPFKPTEGKKVYCKDCFKKYAPPKDERYKSRLKSND